jgi:tryptophan-rich sensory protein
VIVLNYLANAIPINGLTQRDLSMQYQIFLTPSGYVFSIWGLIYLGLAAYIISQALPQRLSDPRLRALDLPFALSCLCNMSWLIVWHYQYITLSMCLMLGLLGSLIWSYLLLDRIGDHSDEASHWFVEQTFSVYLGWVSLATMLNVSILLYTSGWTGGPLTPQLWAVILLGIACALFLYLGLSRQDPEILGVLSWASIGIGLKHQAELMIGITCCVVCVLSLISMGRVLIATKKLNQG